MTAQELRESSLRLDRAVAELTALRAQRRQRAAHEVTSYDSRFKKWDERASVRSKPRRTHTAQPAGTIYFPPELIPVAGHRLVSERGSEAVHYTLIYRLFDYLHFTTELESVAVIPVAGGIARGQSGLQLPVSMRADAFKIVTDEAWHAQFSFDLIQELEEETGLSHGVPGQAAFVPRLDEIRRRLPPELCGMESLLFAVVSETLVSGILADLPRDRRLPRAVRELVADHAEDEGRHHAYFRTFLGHLWQALDAAERRKIGPFIPEIIHAFLEPDYLGIGRRLIQIGLTAEEAEHAIFESWPRHQVIQDVADAARSTVRYFAEAGALADPRTHDAFLSSGLLSPDG